MPPTKNSGASKKVEQKKKERVIEDKTFGLKNKKGSKQQKYIQQVQKQVTSGGNKTAKQLEKEREEQKKLKELKKKELLEINNLFKPVQQAIAKGVDPKSVLCAYFKVGQCSKGNKCKYSHDLNIERRGEKRNAYEESEEKETSADWDEAKLKEVVEKKHARETNRPNTDIICKFFLDAVEEGKYGWFWSCPNGDKCIYKHALPPGFILKKDRKKMESERETINLEDLIERERAALGLNTTKVTLETFLAWKKKKLKEREDSDKKNTEKKRSDYKSGVEVGVSGREMFTFNPDLAAGGVDMEEGDADYDLHNIKPHPEDGEDEENEIIYKEIDFDILIPDYKVAGLSTDANMSIACVDRMEVMRQQFDNIKVKDIIANGNAELEGAIAIDEDLFDGDDEDLDDLDEQLEELAVAS